MNRRGFTIHQVLAVCGIAIALGVIAAPVVSAQGGGKDTKTWYLTQLHTLGTTTMIYLSDHDDVFPLAMVRRPDTEVWMPSTLVPAPQNALNNAPWNTPAFISRAANMWRNSLDDYPTFPAATMLPGAPEHSVSGDVYLNPPKVTHMTMNGLLHAYSLNSMPAPSVVPVFHSGAGRVNLKGRVFSNPALNCSNHPYCVFDPNGPPSSTPTFGVNANMFAFPPLTTHWIYGTSGPILRADTSVAIKPVGTAIAPAIVPFAMATSDPWAQVSPEGYPQTYWNCGPGHTSSSPNGGTPENAYPCYFRPDRTE